MCLQYLSANYSNVMIKVDDILWDTCNKTTFQYKLKV